MADLKLGMIGLDTSHCIAFSNLLNKEDNPHHVAGAKIVKAFPAGSDAFSMSYERVEKITGDVRDQFGVTIVDTIEKAVEDVDGVLLTSVDGRVHLKEFSKIAQFGKPVFIDKPLTTAKKDAEAIFALGREHGAPVMSASSMRYAAGIADLGGDAEALGCVAFGPAAILDDFPGLFWYGIHSAEILFSKMGAGCQEVSVRKTDKADIVTGIWKDGRVGTLYASRIGVNAFGATLFNKDGVHHALAGGSPPAYAMMLKEIIAFMRSGQPPIDPQESIEIIAFLEAANESRETGKVISL